MRQMLIRGGQVWNGNGFAVQDLLIEDGIVINRGENLSADPTADIFELNGLHVFPGFADVHVHLREPGFSYKETIASGSRACAHGGYTSVCTMPNLNPVPDSVEHVAVQQELIDRDSVIRVYPFASITVGQKGEGELTDIEALAGKVCGFSDDGRGVKTADMMRACMQRVKAADSIISAHCEEVSLIPAGGAIHECDYAREHGIPGIPSESEWRMIERDIALAKETGCRYHVCHVSCRKSVELIREAKKDGVDITCETGPHYLLLSVDDLKDEGRFKMNPPLQEKDDCEALIEGLLDGTVDMLATDHAPHSAEEKGKGLAKSAMGIVGIETAFPLLYTCLVKTGRVPMKTIIDKLTTVPRERFRLGGGIEIGDHAELCVFDLNEEYTIDPDTFLSKGRATPFAGWQVSGACKLTVCGDTVAYSAL